MPLTTPPSLSLSLSLSHREIIVACLIHTKYSNTLCGQNVVVLMLNVVVHIVTTGSLVVHFITNKYNFGFRGGGGIFVFGSKILEYIMYIWN